ncbi:MAG: type II secretion system F family protein, partial [Chlamydiota bacterium]
MALFQYKAIGVGGRAEKGVIDADSLVMAKERLRREQVLITDISSLQEDKKKVILSPTQLLAFTRELSQLLKAKLPLYESLLTIEEKQRNAKNHALFVDLCDRLKNGYSFSSALSHYPETFNPIYLSMVLSAEQSSSLFEAFDQLTFLISKQQKLKKQLTSSLAYPAFLGGFCFLVVVALFFFVIPSMKELLEDRKLHPLTQTVLFVSNFLNAHGFLLLFSGIGFLSAAYVSSRSQIVRRKISEGLLRLPFCKKIILESALVRLFRTMTMLLSGGVPLVEALYFSR